MQQGQLFTKKSLYLDNDVLPLRVLVDVHRDHLFRLLVLAGFRFRSSAGSKIQQHNIKHSAFTQLLPTIPRIRGQHSFRDDLEPRSPSQIEVIKAFNEKVQAHLRTNTKIQLAGNQAHLMGRLYYYTRAKTLLETSARGPW